MDEAVKVLGRWRILSWPLLHGPSCIISTNISKYAEKTALLYRGGAQVLGSFSGGIFWTGLVLK
jgi:hypothetical protein